MSEPRPHAPSTGRVIWLIGKFSWTRLANRWARRRGARPGERGVTARKPSAGRLVIAFASVLILAIGGVIFVFAYHVTHETSPALSLPSQIRMAEHLVRRASE